MKYFKLTIYTIIMFLVTRLLSLVARNPIFNFSIFNNTVLNYHLNYQLSGLIIAAVSLLILYIFADKIRLGYLNANRQGKIKPSALLGIKHEGRWESDTWSIGAIMVAIIGAVTLLQTFRLGFSFSLTTILMVVPLAASNAFTEEVIFRLSYVTMGENETNSSLYGLIMGSIVFGVIHYWGIVPNGLFGALISALLGLFLAKSIQETKGFYWAFMIHFLLDVVIMFFIFNVAA
ncbi:hypothetical protein SAMN04488134_101284 [Amphibacillus marinus]|uniref:CAAX prenyl protease 2/Lysostaphin resistance protein A-like domain-containing protein n=1 Tax=Amphibacillus marinus TaxID=872970 RepID=A0A1H8HAS3_9BACI|nr:CPBP family intramembrane glutamic endopeptidase [Amphibacillus marinus]SEN52658.1 hypothetical protein SAMN04488134_101284 [Amphibacillus marinus]